MKIAVWDTYVNRNDKGGKMHFDILVPEDLHDAGQIKKFGLQYLNDKGIATDGISIDKCSFCHVEQVPEEMAKEIEQHGFMIVELSNCD